MVSCARPNKNKTYYAFKMLLLLLLLLKKSPEYGSGTFLKFAVISLIIIITNKLKFDGKTFLHRNSCHAIKIFSLQLRDTGYP